MRKRWLMVPDIVEKQDWKRSVKMHSTITVQLNEGVIYDDVMPTALEIHLRECPYELLILNSIDLIRGKNEIKEISF